MVKIELKKGNGFVFLIGLISLFIVGAFYIIFSDPWDKIYDALIANMDSDFTPTMAKLRTAWKVWPLITLLGIVLWVFLRSMVRDPNSVEFQF